MRHWLARVLSALILVLWALFIYLSHGFSIPSLFEWIFWTVLLIITIVAWKKDFLGGSMFLFLGLFYLLIGWGRVNLTGYLIVPLPLLLIGALFMFNGWRLVKK